MFIQIMKAPSGKFALFCHDYEMWVAKELTDQQVKRWFAIAAEEQASEVLTALENGENPYGRDAIAYRDAEEITRQVGAAQPDALSDPRKARRWAAE